MKNPAYRIISILLLGIILGSVLTNLYMGSHLDYLIMANKALQSDLAEAQYQLQNLKKSSEERKKHTVIGVETFISLDSKVDLTDYDKLSVELEANKKVKDWLSPIIGQDIASLDSLMIPQILDNRELSLNGNTYRLKAYLIVVNKKTTVYLNASQLKAQKIN